MADEDNKCNINNLSLSTGELVHISCTKIFFSYLSVLHDNQTICIHIKVTLNIHLYNW